MQNDSREGPAGRATEETGQKTGKSEDIPGERGNEAKARRDRKGRAGRATTLKEARRDQEGKRKGRGKGLQGDCRGGRQAQKQNH
jgi:hypothetical protein